MSLHQSGCRHFNSLIPNAVKDLSFICSLDFCTNRLSAHEKCRVVVKNYRYLLLFFFFLFCCSVQLHCISSLPNNWERLPKRYRSPEKFQLTNRLLQWVNIPVVLTLNTLYLIKCHSFCSDQDFPQRFGYVFLSHVQGC